MKIASVRGARGRLRADRAAYFRAPDNRQRRHRARPVRRLGLPAGRRGRARRAFAAAHRRRPVPDRAPLAPRLPSAAVPGQHLSAAVSAIDLALWDIKGKALKLPVWELLGGRTATGCGLHVLVGGGTPDEIVSSVNWAVDEGFTAVKFDPLVHGYEDLSMSQLVSSACSMAAAAREAGGDEIDLIFELHRKLDPTKAIVVCNALAQFRPLFIEDPIQIDSIETQAEICKRIDSPIATGERLSSIWEFNELLSRHVAILVRPDVGLAGGLSGCRKIAAIAEAHHCGVVPHNFLGPALTAPTLHLCTTIPNLVTMEYLPLDEDKTSYLLPSPRQSYAEGGYCGIPESPGLGISLVEDYATVAPVAERPFSDEGLLRADGSVAAAS